MNIDGRTLEKGDFYRVSDGVEYTIETKNADVFIIENQVQLAYKSYYEMVGARWCYPASSCVELLILALYW